MTGNVRVIPPREKEPSVLWSAAYCRVSSDSFDQLHSYAAQIRGYTEEISKHEGWKLVDIYADEGLSGPRMDKRGDFNRMLSDCQKGRIDKILVKSISRFARNTKDCLVSLRELTKLGVSVDFAKEEISTERLTTELMVSVYGALAQQESISIAQNQRIQSLAKRRARKVSPAFGGVSSFQKIVCRECRTVFTRKTARSGYVIWVCRRHDRRAADCPVGRIAESEFYAAFMRMYNQLKLHEGIILKPALGQLHDLNDTLQRGSPAMLAVNRAIAETTDRATKSASCKARVYWMPAPAPSSCETLRPS